MGNDPTRALLGDLAGVAREALELARLQWRLFLAESRWARRRAATALVTLGAGLCAAAWGMPLAVAGGAVLLGQYWQLSPAASVCLAGIALLAAGIGASAAAYQWLARQKWFARSSAELQRNLDALRPPSSIERR